GNGSGAEGDSGGGADATVGKGEGAGAGVGVEVTTGAGTGGDSGIAACVGADADEEGPASGRFAKTGETGASAVKLASLEAAGTEGGRPCASVTAGACFTIGKTRG